MRCHLPRATPENLGLFHLSILSESFGEGDLFGLSRCHFRNFPAETLIPELLDLLQPGLLLVARVSARAGRGANFIKGSLGVPHFPYEPQSKHTYANECDNAYRRQEDN